MQGRHLNLPHCLKAMNKAKQAKYGRKGGSKTGETKRRDVDYAELARKSWAKRREKQSKVTSTPVTAM